MSSIARDCFPLGVLFSTPSSSSSRIIDTGRGSGGAANILFVGLLLLPLLLLVAAGFRSKLGLVFKFGLLLVLAVAAAGVVFMLRTWFLELVSGCKAIRSGIEGIGGISLAVDLKVFFLEGVFFSWLTIEVSDDGAICLVEAERGFSRVALGAWVS